MSKRVAQERRKTQGELQLWRRCFPAIVPVIPPCSCSSLLVRTLLQKKKKKEYGQEGKKISAWEGSDQ